VAQKKVTSSASRAARSKGGKTVITQGNERNRTQRASLGSPGPRRPLATGGVKTGPLQGGTRTASASNQTPSRTKPANVVRRQGKLVPRTPANLGRGQVSPKPAAPAPAAAPSKPAAAGMVRRQGKLVPRTSANLARGQVGGKAPTASPKPAPPKAAPAAKPTASASSSGGGGASAKDVARLTRRAQKLGTGSLRTARGPAVTQALRNVRGGGAPSQLTRLAKDALLLSRLTPAGVAAAVSAPRPTSTRDTLSSQGLSRFANARDLAIKRAKAIKGSPVVGSRKASSSQGGSSAKSFDSSFAAARKAGKSTFTWRGKKYNTKLRGE
jgi:hypothetical protein